MGAIRNLHVSLDDDVSSSLDAAVASGDYDSDGEIVREALEAWKREREANSARLRMLMEEALASGDPVEVTDAWFDDIIRRGRERLKATREQR